MANKRTGKGSGKSAYKFDRNREIINAKKSFVDYLPLELFYMLLMLFVVAIVPLIVSFANNIPTAPEEIAMFRSPQYQFDFFSFIKSIYLKYSTILLGIIFALDFYRKNFSANAKLKLSDFYKRPEIIAYLAFFLFTLIAALVDNNSKFVLFGVNEANSILVSVPLYFIIFSPLAFIITGRTESRLTRPVAFAVLTFFFCVMLTMTFTKFKYLTFHGANERYESIYAVLGYILIFVSVIQFADTAKKLRIIMYGLMFSATVLGLVGALQFLGMDFFTTESAAKLIYGKHYVDGAGININFTQSFSLLYNPNSLGLYAAMVSASFFFSAVFLPRQNPLKYVFSVLFFICVIALIGSNSAAGAISGVIAFSIGGVVGIIYAAKKLRNVKHLLIGGGITLALVAAIVFIVPGVNSRVNYFVDKLFAIGSSYDHQFLKDLRAEGNVAELVSTSGKASVAFYPDLQSFDVSFNDEPVQPYQIDEPDEYGAVRFRYQLPGFGEFTVLCVNELLSFNTHGFIYNFYFSGNKLYYVTSAGTLYDLNTEVPRFGFEGKETFANGRGYLWSRTIPLMKNALIKGYGIDAFAEAFPQHDIAGRIRHIGQSALLIDKAHNGYLQIAVTTGVLSMLAVIFLIGYYLTRAFKNILARDDTDRVVFALKFGLAIGVVAYAIGFLSTDSIVGVSPMFWGLLGLGFAATQLSSDNKDSDKGGESL